MNVFEGINQAILIILAFSTLVGILDFVGFLPHSIRKWLRLNRADEMIETLRELGMDIDQRRRVNKAVNYPKKLTGENIEKSTEKQMKNYIINRSVSVGQNRRIESSYYYDLIGATCDENVAKYFAGALMSYWSEHLIGDHRIESIDFDFVVTPKDGSPILGYEFSKLVKKPFILHEGKSRFLLEGDMREKFDCLKTPDAGKIALIVDDSTTGGTMVCNTIDDLRHYGYQVNVCFVVFEPVLKNARKRIEDKNVKLVSILKTHDAQGKKQKRGGKL